MLNPKSVIRGDRIKALREGKGLSPHALAVQIHSTDADITAFENKERDPSTDQIQRLSDALDVSPSYLLGLTDEPAYYLTEDDLTPEERIILAALRDARTKH